MCSLCRVLKQSKSWKCLQTRVSGRLVVLDDLPHLLLVRYTILLEQIVGLGLRWRLRVDLVEKHLDAEKDLLDGDGGLPGFLFIQDRKADGAGGVDVRVEERGCEFACHDLLIFIAYQRLHRDGIAYTSAAW